MRRGVRSLVVGVAFAVGACGSGGGGSSVIEETARIEDSSSADFWVNSGGRFVIAGGFGHPILGDLPPGDPWRQTYAQTNPTDTDGGVHPQNIFRLITRHAFGRLHEELTFHVLALHASASPERNESNGVLVFSEYLDQDDLYYAGVRVDGAAVIKKKLHGAYTTLGLVPIYPGSYDRDRNPNLIPTDRSITITMETQPNADQTVDIGLSVDASLALQVHDDGIGGPAISGPGFAGIRTDFVDVEFERFVTEGQ